MDKMIKAKLVLEDGSSFDGLSTGLSGERAGKVVLNTAVVGYQEIMTDPANAGKILILTYPLIGNYGVAKKFYESKKCWLTGVIMKEKSRIYSNWQAEGSLDDFIKKESLNAINDIDTRTLAVTIRDKGEIFGIISAGDSNESMIANKIEEFKNGAERDFIKEISVKKPVEIKSEPAGPKIAVLDLGMLNGFTKQLTNLGCNVTLLPFNTSAKAISAMRPQGLIISGGPEDDAAIPKIVQEIKQLIGKIPMLGISLGHEIIALALGGKLNAMKIGHHGANYPVKASNSYKGEITVQNHSFVVNERSISGNKRIAITLRNVNDDTIEEMESRFLKFISTQYYPVSPEFEEVNEVFNRFLKITGARLVTGKRHFIKRTSGSNKVYYAKA